MRWKNSRHTASSRCAKWGLLRRTQGLQRVYNCNCIGLYLGICRTYAEPPGLQIRVKTLRFNPFSKEGFFKNPDQLRLKFVEIPWNLQGKTHLQWLAQRGIFESHQRRRDLIWIFHLHFFRSEKPKGGNGVIWWDCHGLKAYLFRKIYATQRTMISKEQNYYNMYTNINYTLRISDWTLQKEGVWICVVGRVLLDLQTTSY